MFSDRRNRRWTPAEAAAFLHDRRLASGPLEATRLDGGYLNDVFRVQGNCVDWVVKRFAVPLKGTLFPNLPVEEARALDMLAALDVAPKPVAFHRDGANGDVLVYAYSRGRPWRGDVEGVALLLRRLRTVDGTSFRRVPATFEEIVAQGDTLFAECARDSRMEAYRSQRPLSRGAAEPSPPLGLIHTDVGAMNLIEGPHGLHLIDWQCPAHGDPAEDVYSFLSPAFQVLNRRDPLSGADRHSFLKAYDDAQLSSRLDALWPAFAYRMAGYCVLRHQTLKGQDEAARERYRRALAVEFPGVEAP